MADILYNFGRKLAEIRNQKGMSQEKLAEMIGYSTNHISKLELARTNPSFELLIKIASHKKAPDYEKNWQNLISRICRRG